MNEKVFSSRRANAVWAVCVPFLAAVCGAPCTGAQSGVPQPPAGHWARTTAALLNYGHDQCSGVGERTLAYWKRLSGGDVEAALEQYSLTRARAELAGARRSLDIAHGFLQTAISEIDEVEDRVLDLLYEADVKLCNVVAGPAPPRSDYESRVDGAEAEVLAAKQAVMEVLPPNTTDQELAKELQPYLEAIELAAGVERERVRQEMEAIKPPPERPSAQDLMETWFDRYQQAVAPAKSALRAYLEGRQKNDAAALQVACKELQETVLPLLVDEQSVFLAPDAAVEKPLKAVYTAMRRIGTHCSAGRFKEADEAYAWLQEQLNRAAGALAQYSLRP